MQLEPNPWALVPLAAAALAFGAAVLVGRSRPARRQSVSLAGVLAAEGAFALVNAVGAVSPDGALPELAERALLAVVGAQIVAYVAFLGTLETPLARPLRPAWVVALAGAAVAVLVVGSLATGAGASDEDEHAGVGALQVAWLLVPLWGLAVAVSFWRRAPAGTPEKARAGSFALAFVLRDGGWAFVVASAAVPAALGLPPQEDSVFWSLLPVLVILAYVPVLAYGILRHRVLDIDLRIRWGIERGTVAAAFVVVYVVASQATHHLVTPELGPAVGIVAAGLVALALVPLQRLAERFAARVMPGVASTPEYLDERRLDVYRAALHDAYEAGGGVVRPADARLLARLRDGLGLTERDHALLDHAVRRARGAREGRAADDGLLFGRFRPERVLGEGSMGKALLADDLELGRRVVLKVAHRAVAADAVLAEARALARVRHPNVVTVHDAARAGDDVYLVLEHAEGGSLRDRLARGPLARDEFERTARDLLSGLEAVHAAGLVHRDVKPANVLLTREGAKLADFGVAHLPGLEETMGLERAPPAGTARFMAPEQAKGRPATPRSDLHAAAATLFEALAGRPLVEARPNESAVELQMRVARGVPYPAGGCGDARLDAWFRKALAPRAEDRFASAREMRDALEAALARAA